MEGGIRCWHYLSSHAVTRILLSAHMSLTSVFGMGTGGPSWQSTPTIQGYTLKTEHRIFVMCIRRLEPAILCRTSPRLISIGQLNTSRCVHLRPINDIVYVEPYSLKDERSYLRGSFTLRCFQRLSRPYVATQLCPWQNNWCTRGTSIPVLSY